MKRSVCANAAWQEAEVLLLNVKPLQKAQCVSKAVTGSKVINHPNHIIVRIKEHVTKKHTICCKTSEALFHIYIPEKPGMNIYKINKHTISYGRTRSAYVKQILPRNTAAGK